MFLKTTKKLKNSISSFCKNHENATQNYLNLIFDQNQGFYYP